jgi:hypothetical protein
MTLEIYADYRHVDFDPKADFGAFKTFLVRDGTTTTNTPELNSWFMRKKINDAIRANLSARGLTEAQGRADLVASWELGARNGRGVQEVSNGRGNLRSDVYDYKEGTLTIRLLDANSAQVWQGVYRDDERNPSKLAANLPRDIKKLFDDFPPKKK